MTSKKIVAVPKFCYMKVTLEFDSDSNVEMTAAQFKFLIVKMLKELFGQNSVPSVDVLLFKEDKRQAILRFQNSERTKIWATLSCTSSYKDIPCIFHVHQTSCHLMSLAADSRSNAYFQPM